MNTSRSNHEDKQFVYQTEIVACHVPLWSLSTNKDIGQILDSDISFGHILDQPFHVAALLEWNVNLFNSCSLKNNTMNVEWQRGLVMIR